MTIVDAGGGSCQCEEQAEEQETIGLDILSSPQCLPMKLPQEVELQRHDLEV